MTTHITPAELAAVAERHPEIAQDELEIDDHDFHKNRDNETEQRND